MALAEEGFYKGRVRSWDLVKKNGKYQIVFYAVFTDWADVTADPTSDANFVKLERPLKKCLFYHISDNNKGMVLSELQALGYPAAKLDAKVIKPGNEESFDFSQNEAVFELEHGSYPEKIKGVETGKMKDTERIRVNRRKAVEKLPLEDVDQFNQLFGQEEEGGPLS